MFTKKEKRYKNYGVILSTKLAFNYFYWQLSFKKCIRNYWISKFWLFAQENLCTYTGGIILKKGVVKKFFISRKRSFHHQKIQLVQTDSWKNKNISYKFGWEKKKSMFQRQYIQLLYSYEKKSWCTIIDIQMVCVCVCVLCDIYKVY